MKSFLSRLNSFNLEAVLSDKEIKEFKQTIDILQQIENNITNSALGLGKLRNNSRVGSETASYARDLRKIRDLIEDLRFELQQELKGN